MKYNFKFNLDDHIQALRDAASYLYPIKGKLVLFAVILGFFGLFIALGYLLFNFALNFMVLPELWEALLMAWLPLILLVIFWVILLKFYQTVCLKITLHFSKVPDWNGSDVDFEITSSGLKVNYIYGHSEIHWSAIQKIGLSKKNLYFIYGMNAVYLPISTFQDEIDRSAFFKECLKHLTPEALKISKL